MSQSIWTDFQHVQFEGLSSPVALAKRRPKPMKWCHHTTKTHLKMIYLFYKHKQKQIQNQTIFSQADN